MLLRWKNQLQFSWHNIIQFSRNDTYTFSNFFTVVLVFYCCCNKSSQTWWLQTTHICYVTVWWFQRLTWVSRSWDHSVSMAILPAGSRGGWLHCLSSCWRPPALLGSDPHPPLQSSNSRSSSFPAPVVSPVLLTHSWDLWPSWTHPACPGKSPYFKVSWLASFILISFISSATLPPLPRNLMYLQVP